MLGLDVGAEPTSWILWGLAGIIGIPFNIGALIILYSLFEYIARYHSEVFTLLDINALVILFWVVVSSAIIGAHVNGVILANIIKRHGVLSNMTPNDSVK